jgi:hypothetical protein
VIEREEHYLERAFGEEYLAYKERCAAGCSKLSFREDLFLAVG